MAEGFQTTIEDKVNHYKNLFKNREISIPEIKKKLHPDYFEIDWEKNNNKMRNVLEKCKSSF